MWHQRNSFPESEVERGNLTSKSQSEKILEWFEKNPLAKETPFGIASKLFSPDVPVTSIRRALTDLTKDGKLVKLAEQTKERYGVSNCFWMLSPKSPQTQLNFE